MTTYFRHSVPNDGVIHEILNLVDTFQAVQTLVQQEGHVVDQHVHKTRELPSIAAKHRETDLFRT